MGVCWDGRWECAGREGGSVLGGKVGVCWEGRWECAGREGGSVLGEKERECVQVFRYDGYWTSFKSLYQPQINILVYIHKLQYYKHF